VREFKQDLEEKGHLIKVDEKPFSISVVTPMMQRALEIIGQDPVQIFIDSSASCDQTNSSITTLLIPTKAGAVPIAVCIHANQTEINYTSAFQLTKDNWSETKINIEAFMTDDACAMKNALETVWPGIRQLLCQFHVSSAFWNYLCTPKNGVNTDVRVSYMAQFRKIMYSSSISEATTNYETLHSSLEGNCKVKKHLMAIWERRAEWCLAFRMDVLNRSNNTNNYAEATFRVFKDIILCRLKAHNAISLLSFVAFELDEYYAMRLTSHSYDKIYRCSKIFVQTIDRGQILVDTYREKLKKVGDYVFSVPSASDEEISYTVNSQIGHCTCVSGSQGAYCKHMSAVTSIFNIEFPNCPALSPQDKSDLYYIGNGSRMNADFFLPLSGEMPAELDNSKADSFANGNIDSDKENEWESAVSDSDSESDCFEEPLRKRQKLNEQDDVKKLLSDGCKNIQRLFAEHCSDEYLVKSVKLFARGAAGLETGMQLASFLGKGKKATFKVGRKIPPQPASVSRRKNPSRSKRVLKAGRPINGVRKSKKRKHDFGGNVEKNVPNAKSHGDGH
jgi:hypothetical protein